MSFNKRLFILNCAYAILKGIIIGFKCVALFYLTFCLGCIIKIDDFLMTCISGIVNGFLDALLLSTKSPAIQKIFSAIIGILAAFYIFLQSLYSHLPDIMVDYFIYGEGGGGLEPGGWFGFFFDISIYIGTSLFVFLLSKVLLSKE